MSWSWDVVARGAGQLGAVSQRLLLALAASALLTAAVSLPMAYQAHEARQRDAPTSVIPGGDPDVEVLGATTSRQVDTDDGVIRWRADSQVAAPLHRAQLRSGPTIFVQMTAVVRADFRLDDGPVLTDTTTPFEFDDGSPVALDPGTHSVTVTVTDRVGDTTLHQATFVVIG